VTVDNLDIQRLLVDEMETDAPLRIDPDSPLRAALSLKGFQPVAGRRVQTDDGVGGVDHQQLATRKRV
jgi:hypothetical protein